MRIFCAIEEEPFPGNRLWHNNIVEALKDLGHEVVLFQFPLDPFYKHANTHSWLNRFWVTKNRPVLEAALVNQISFAHKNNAITLFLSYFYSAHCTSKTLQMIQQMGIKTVNWYCNASYQFDLVQDIAPSYDLCLVPEKDRLSDYERIGAHPLYCQEAANPNFYKNAEIQRDLGIVFIGQNYATREAYCRALYQQDLPIQIWGGGWERSFSSLRKLLKTFRRVASSQIIPASAYHGFCTDEQMVQIYNRAKIALGFGVVWSADYHRKPIYQIRLRDFEAPMCGTFYLTEHQDELSEFFKIGEEIETFRNQEELVSKATYYLKHDSVRDRIRLAGHQRVLRDHTWQKRLTEVLRHLA